MSVLRSPLYSPLRSPLRSPLTRLKGGGVFSPLDLFQTGDILVWYDPSDLSTMFQDVAGTTPVTADGQSVALIRDKGPGGYHRTQATPSSCPKYKTNGTLHWLLYDGIDDSQQTSAINWGTNEVAYSSGVMKATSGGVICEFSAQSATNNGAFGVFGSYTFVSRGTTFIGANGSTNAPDTTVLSCYAKIATPVVAIREDGALVQSVATSQGTGNYGNHALNFGRRNNASLPFNGREYQTVIRSRLLSDAELAKLETFVAAKTGLTL